MAKSALVLVLGLLLLAAAERRAITKLQDARLVAPRAQVERVATR